MGCWLIEVGIFFSNARFYGHLAISSSGELAHLQTLCGGIIGLEPLAEGSPPRVLPRLFPFVVFHRPRKAIFSGLSCGRKIQVKSLPADNPPLYDELPPTGSQAETGGPHSHSAHEAPSSPSPAGVFPHRQRAVGQSVSLLTSAALHGLALMLLSLVLFQMPRERPQAWLQGAFDEASSALELDVNELDSASGELSMAQELAIDLPTTDNLANTSIVEPSQLELPTTTAESTRAASTTDAMSQPLASRGGGLDGRMARNRRSLALAGGGTEASESAVERGLAWLAAHQLDDGSWQFNLEACPQCAGACRHSGFRTSTTDSTGLALLCFLGAGYTHQEGPYQESVANGLYYLDRKMLLTSMGGDLRDRSLLSEQQGNVLMVQKNGDMYSHAIATLALCEAYAMTRDERWVAPAQKAVDFIVHAQHEGGGWRYEPGEPGDLSVSGWQITALKSASHGKLEIPREVWYRAMSFLDGLQDDRGAAYGYQQPTSKKPSMSVVGLFARMMLGWPHDHRPLLRGVAQIGDALPQKNNMYFNYYASQLLRHHGGSAWKRWNPKMRDYLVALQATQGHETGSWYIDEDWSDRGGRLYSTTLAILTLEVYYRYMPMYQEAFLD